MAAFPLTGNALRKSEMEYHRKFGNNLGRIQHIALMIRIKCFTQPDFWKPKLWHTHLLDYKASSAALNSWLITHLNQNFILIIIMMAQMSSDLHGVGIKLKTRQPIIV